MRKGGFGRFGGRRFVEQLFGFRTRSRRRRRRRKRRRRSRVCVGKEENRELLIGTPTPTFSSPLSEHKKSTKEMFAEKEEERPPLKNIIPEFMAKEREWTVRGLYGYKCPSGRIQTWVAIQACSSLSVSCKRNLHGMVLLKNDQTKVGKKREGILTPYIFKVSIWEIIKKKIGKLNATYWRISFRVLPSSLVEKERDRSRIKSSPWLQ